MGWQAKLCIILLWFSPNNLFVNTRSDLGQFQNSNLVCDWLKNKSFVVFEKNCFFDHGYSWCEVEGIVRLNLPGACNACSFFLVQTEISFRHSCIKSVSFPCNTSFANQILKWTLIYCCLPVSLLRFLPLLFYSKHMMKWLFVILA